MYDTHIHTNNSPDSKQTIDEICMAAIEKGLCAISICDHAEVSIVGTLNHRYEDIENSIRDVKMARDKYKGQLKIFQGIELAELFWDKSKVQNFLSLGEYDVVLGSVHRVDCEGYNDSFSRIDMSVMPEKMVDNFLNCYFEDMLKMARDCDFDVLSHLTIPIRYTNGKYQRGIDILKYTDKILEILRIIIDRRIALEVNTSGIDTALGDFMPNQEILRMYKDMGGELVTIGSDAHTPERVGYGLKEAQKLLKEIGFTHYHYYEKRKPVKVEL